MPKIDIGRAWLLALIQEYRDVRAGAPALASLRLPNFRLSNELVSTLGSWDEEERALTLATSLFEHCRWDEVVATLKHEMAHQIVSELYRVSGAQPHGEAFRRACKLLCISPSARAVVRAGPTGEGAIARRVRKLLALGDSPNRHEAEAALAKAQELALRHNLERIDADDHDYGIRLVGPLFRRIPSPVWAIAGIVADFYFVLYISRQVEDPASGQRFKLLELYGNRDNLDLAEYVFLFLLAQVDLQWRRYKTANALRGVRQKLSFQKGMLTGFRTKLEAQRQQLANEQALVWLGDPRLDAFYRQRNPRVSSSSRSARVYSDAHSAGVEVGRRLRVRPGLQRNRSATTPQRLLPDGN